MISCCRSNWALPKGNHINLKGIIYELISIILEINCQICIPIKILLVASSRKQTGTNLNHWGVWRSTSEKISDRVDFRCSVIKAPVSSLYHTFLSSVSCVSHLYPQPDFFHGGKMAAEIPGLTSAHFPYIRWIWHVTYSTNSDLMPTHQPTGLAHTKGCIMEEERNGIWRNKCFILHTKQSLFLTGKETAQGKEKNKWGSGFTAEAYLTLLLKLSSTFP